MSDSVVAVRALCTDGASRIYKWHLHNGGRRGLGAGGEHRHWHLDSTTEEGGYSVNACAPEPLLVRRPSDDAKPVPFQKTCTYFPREHRTNTGSTCGNA